MNKIKVKVIIGANYGDEGKGLATNYFATKYDKDKCLNVLFNGGCQRGHTITLRNGISHVFHHFGAASFSDAYNYFDQDFMLNPIFFMDEYYKLKQTYHTNLRCFASGNCRITTPYDAFINQIVENGRMTQRHGSCGYGILETRKRYEDGRFIFYFKDLSILTDNDLYRILSDIAEIYLPQRLHLLKFDAEGIPEEYKKLIKSKELREKYIQDLREMQKLIKIEDFNNLAKNFDLILFEGGQGLALDENNLKDFPHLTPSSTNSSTPLKRLRDLDCEVEICYVTRTYFTRHGAGPLPSECKKEQINPDIVDLTNVPNPYQETLRYGLFDKEAFFDRVFVDMTRARNINPNVKFSLFISQLNYSNYDLAGNCTISELIKYFEQNNFGFSSIYFSDSKYSEKDMKLEILTN